MTRTYQTSRTNPKQPRGKETVRKILTAATSLFDEFGVSEVSTNQIAEKAGIPVGTIYRYFSDKSAIIDSLLDLYVEDTQAIMQKLTSLPLFTPATWEELFNILLHNWAEYHRINRPQAFINYLRATPSYLKSDANIMRRNIQPFCDMLNHRWLAKDHRTPIQPFPDALICLEMSLIVVNRSTLLPEEMVEPYLADAAKMMSSLLQDKYPLQEPPK